MDSILVLLYSLLDFHRIVGAMLPLHIGTIHRIQYTIHSTQYPVHSTHNTVHSTQCTVNAIFTHRYNILYNVLSTRLPQDRSYDTVYKTQDSWSNATFTLVYVIYSRLDFNLYYLF